MPVEYTIDPSRNMIRTRCLGDTTLPEVLSHFEELDGDSGRPVRPDVLLDLSGMTSLPNSEEIRGAAKRVGQSSRLVRYRACAIVARREALYGMIRMFEVLAESHFERTAVFRTVGDADVWLMSRVAERVGRGESI